MSAPAATEAFVAGLLGSMSLEEKVGQMIQADIASITPEDLRTYRLGAILAGGGAAPGNFVRTTPRAWRDLAAAFSSASRAADSGAHQPIPVLFGIDAVHGHAKMIGATIFPHNVALGAANDPQLVERIGAATAEEVKATGIDWTFAPTVAVARDARWGRAYESYGEAPELVARYAAAMVTGLQGERGTSEYLSPGHTLSSVKHFVGDGATAGGRDQGDAQVSEEVLSHVHGAGYAAAIRAGAMIVMASYNSWHGVKVHSSHYLLTDVLKGRMGFNGFVVGDWNAHEQIPGCTKYSCPEAILAGVDMLMAPDSWKRLLTNTVAQVRAGTIPMSRIDDAVTRILRVKALAGLFSRAPLQAGGEGFAGLGSTEHRALAREAVRRSLVLLKNNHATLPLNPAARVLIAGRGADDIGMQSGGWSIDWQGDHNTNADFPGGTSIYAGIKAAVESAGGAVTRSADGRFVDRPDVAIVVFGETPYAEFQGDRQTLEYSPQDRSDLELLRRLRAAHVPVVAVFLSGRPLWVNPELNAADAFVAAWLPGSEGEGIADVLFRRVDGTAPYDFTGRLGFSWPDTAMPVRYGAGDEVQGALFARGYGLSYAHPAQLGRLPEEPRIPPSQRAAGGKLIHAHQVIAPWSIFVADPLAEVRMTSSRRASPQGAVVAQLDAAALRLRWTGEQSGLFRISGRPEDLRARAADGLRVVLRYRVLSAPSAPVRIGLRCAAPYSRDPPVPAMASAPPAAAAELCGTASGAMIDESKALRGARDQAWHVLSISLLCLTRQGADLADVEAPLAIETTGTLEISISEAGLEPGPRDPACD